MGITNHISNVNFSAHTKTFNNPLYKPSVDQGLTKWAKVGPQNLGVNFTVQTKGGHKTVNTAQLDAKPRARAPKDLMGTKLVAWQKANGQGLPHVDPQAKDFRPTIAPTDTNYTAQMFDYRTGKETGLGVVHRAIDVATFGGSFVAKNVAAGGIAVAAVGMTKAQKAGKPLEIALTGGTGNIGSHTTFKIANGDLAADSVNLRLFARLESPNSISKLEGLKAEVRDLGAANRTIHDISIHNDYRTLFKDVDLAMLVGAAPRPAGAERIAVLAQNGPGFREAAIAFNEVAPNHAKTAILGNPVNNNTDIFGRWLGSRFGEHAVTGVSKIDESRVIGMLAERLKVPPSEIKNVAIFGNHDSTLAINLSQATVRGEPISKHIDKKWFEEVLVPTVQNRGGEIKNLRGISSVGSASQALIDHANLWLHGTPQGGWTTMVLRSDGSYGVPAGMASSFPVEVAKGGTLKIVQGLQFDSFGIEGMKKTIEGLQNEVRLSREFWPHFRPD